MGSWTGIPELKQSYRQLGAAKFLSLMAGVLAWIALLTWLSVKVDWPDAYGFHCSGRGCLFDDLWHSPALLQHGGIYADALFVCMWAMIVIPAAFVIWSKLRKRWRADDLSVPISSSDPE